MLFLAFFQSCQFGNILSFNYKHLCFEKSSSKHVILNYNLFNHNFISFTKNFWEMDTISKCVMFPTIKYSYYKSKFP